MVPRWLYIRSEIYSQLLDIIKFASFPLFCPKDYIVIFKPNISCPLFESFYISFCIHKLTRCNCVIFKDVPIYRQIASTCHSHFRIDREKNINAWGHGENSVNTIIQPLLQNMHYWLKRQGDHLVLLKHGQITARPHYHWNDHTVLEYTSLPFSQSK